MNNVCTLSPEECCRPCSGCGICAAVCPVEAIRMHFDGEGFYMPEVDETVCVGCGRCSAVCQRREAPSSEALYQRSSVHVYSMQAQDNGLLAKVSSGGVAALLARDAVRCGMQVVGCAYDPESDRCRHAVAESGEELGAFYGSKYIPSETQDAFSQILRGMPHGQCVVFGTPCQISGLDRALRMRGVRERFLLVDLFCKGIPSRLLWSSYLKDLHQNCGIGAVEAVNFRDKEKSWREFSLTVRDTAGHSHSGTVYNDLYLMFMVRNVAFRMSCYSCPFRHHETAADLRLGDFWGPRYYQDQKGVSLVVSFTQQGEQALARIRPDCKTEEICDKGDVLVSQRFDRLPVWEYRDALLSDLQSGMTLTQANEKYKVTSISVKYKKEKTE